MISYTSFSFFVIFFGITFVLYSISPKIIKWCVLLIGSYAFYFISARGHIISIVLSSLIIWAIGLALNYLDTRQREKRKLAEKEEKKLIKARYNRYKRAAMSIGVISALSLLLITKYSNFFIDTVNTVFSAEFNNVSIIQPLGISFFSLQAVSYIVDVYYGRTEAEKNPLKVSLYLSFMLTVVEGPIARYGELAPQLYEGKQNNIEDISKVLSHSGTRIKAAKWHFKNEKGIKCTYDNFKIL